jgi:hypothetical protein
MQVIMGFAGCQSFLVLRAELLDSLFNVLVLLG